MVYLFFVFVGAMSDVSNTHGFQEISLTHMLERLSFKDTTAQDSAKQHIQRRLGFIPKRVTRDMAYVICYHLPPPCRTVDDFVQKCFCVGYARTEVHHAREFFVEQRQQVASLNIPSPSPSATFQPPPPTAFEQLLLQNPKLAEQLFEKPNDLLTKMAEHAMKQSQQAMEQALKQSQQAMEQAHEQKRREAEWIACDYELKMYVSVTPKNEQSDKGFHQFRQQQTHMRRQEKMWRCAMQKGATCTWNTQHQEYEPPAQFRFPDTMELCTPPASPTSILKKTSQSP